jgi:hypothetical protein
MRIGSARLSTLEENRDLQDDALKAAGCAKVDTDKTGRTKAERPGLERALAALRAGQVEDQPQFRPWRSQGIASDGTVDRLLSPIIITDRARRRRRAGPPPDGPRAGQARHHGVSPGGRPVRSSRSSDRRVGRGIPGPLGAAADAGPPLRGATGFDRRSGTGAHLLAPDSGRVIGASSPLISPAIRSSSHASL